MLDDGSWTDADVAQLGLCTGLESLDVGDCCRVSRAVLRLLRANIPMVTVHGHRLDVMLDAFLFEVKTW